MNYTKVNVKKELVEQVKIKATADGRSIANYIERLIVKDLTSELAVGAEPSKPTKQGKIALSERNTK